MLTRLLVSALLLAAAPVAAAEKSFPVGPFTKVMASGSEDVVITTGKAASVTATGPQERLDRLEIDVDGDTLRIRHKRGNYNSWGDGDVTIRVTTPALHGLRQSGSGNSSADAGSGPDFGLSVSGSGNVSIQRIASPSATIAVSGSGDAKVGGLETGPLAISTSGSGNVMAAGSCKTATINVSGSSDIAAPGLRCTDADIGISGSGDVALAATGNVAIRVSGSGNVDITGGARCQTRSSGSGTVTCR